MSSIGIAVLAAVMFATVVGALTYQTLKLRAWFFYMMIIAGVVETVGFLSRAYWTAYPDSVFAFLTSYISIILGPSFAAAGCYMAFSRLLRFVTPESRYNARSLWLPPTWITFVFVSADVGSFCVQLLGLLVVAEAYTPSSPPEGTSNTIGNGTNILKLGLILQLLCFGIFGILGARFLYIAQSWAAPGRTEWRLLGWAILGSAALITYRAIYRVIEFSGTAASSYIMQHEWLFWTCEAFPMLLVFLSFVFINPGSYFPKALLGIRRSRSKLSKILV